MTTHGELAHPFINGALPRPGLDRIIVAGREELVSMRVPFDKLHVLVMAGQDTAARILHHITVFFLKNPDRFVARACSYILASWTPSGTFHLIFLAFKRLIWLKV